MNTKQLCQYMTPEWAADELVEEFFPDLSARDTILEPCCGKGAFLKAIPENIEAVGIELDDSLARIARENTGRQIISGDFRMVPIDIEPTLIISNPPYRVKLLSEFLDRAATILPENGRCGFLLSSYMLQTPSTVLRWNEQWALDQRIVPRTLFPRSIRPMVFVLFTKDKERKMCGGFALYQAAAEISGMSGRIKMLLIEGSPRKQCWRALVELALETLGGGAHLSEIYKFVEPRRRSPNQWWKEKIRQTLQRHFKSTGNGNWTLKQSHTFK